MSGERLSINDMTNSQKFIDELNKLLIITSGFDRPRYIDIASARSGFVGFDEWSQHFNKPVGVFVGAGGNLNNTKFYSIVVVPKDLRYSDGLDFRTGNPNFPSLPIVAAGAGGVINFTLVPLHPQQGNDAVGTNNNTSATVMVDPDANFVASEFIGSVIFNITDNSSGVVTANTTTSITVAALLGGTANTWVVGDKYNVRNDETQERDIFASEGDTAAQAFTNPFQFVGSIADNTTTTFTLTDPPVLADFVDTNRFQPPNAKLVIQAANRTFVTGGITENRGKFDFTETTVARTVTDVTITTSDFGTAQGQILRYIISVALPSDVEIGSFVNVSGMALGGNNFAVDKRILQIDTAAGLWFEVLNDELTSGAEAGAAGTATLSPNQFVGNTSGADETFLSEGMVGADFVFTDSAGSPIDKGLIIGEVDVVNQTFRPTSLYDGRITASTNYRISSAYALFWSNRNNLHVYPAENVISIPFQVLASGVISRFLILFGESNTIRIPIDAPEQGFTIVSETIGCRAPYSVVEAENRLYFFDGDGFSSTEGVNTESITAFKLSDFLADINPLVTSNIRGIFNPKNDRVRFYFALTDSVTNDHGFEYNIKTGDIYPLQRADVNAVWIEPNDDGQDRIHHGSTARHTDSGKSYVWQHDVDFEDDGLPATSEDIAQVNSIAGLTAANYTAGTANFEVQGLNTDFIIGGASTPPFLNEGVPFIVRSNSSIFEARGVIKKMEEAGSTTPKSFTVTIASDYNIGDEVGSGVQTGFFFHLGMIKFLYGPKWEDFGSPRFLHQIKQIQLDLEPSGPAIFFIDHLINGRAVVKKTSVVFVDSARTKTVSPFRQGKAYQYGFRIRCYATKRIKIQNISILWHTPV